MTECKHLAVVICTYNRSASLTDTLTSIYNCGYVGAECIDVIVVANNCNDDTLARLEEFKSRFPQSNLKLSWIDEPRAGKSYALNAAIQQTHHDILCFIDDDQTVEPGFLANLLSGIAAHPEDSMYCGRIWPAWDGSEPEWVHAKPPYSIPIRPFPEFDLGKQAMVIQPQDRFPSGGNISVRRQVFDQVGLFSVELGPTGHNLAGGEDHDFLRRASGKGLSIRYLPDVRQLHAIDAERMSKPYTLRKSYTRSRSGFMIRADEKQPRLYMFRKIISHFGSAIFTFNSDHHFFYLVRLAASMGELSGALELYRNRARRKNHIRIPPDRGTLLVEALALVAAASGIVAWFASGEGHWNGFLPALGVAATGTFALLVKSISDFSQTGPRIREEVLTYYRRYTLKSMARLSIWAFMLMFFMGGGGVLLYYALSVSMGWAWSSWIAALAAILSLLGATGLQFIRKLRFNPGLLVASMHYRMSRLHTLWQWATPGTIRIIEAVSGGAVVLLLMTASWQLAKQNQAAELMTLWAAAIFYVSFIAWAEWLPNARPARKGTPPRVGKPNILLIGSDTLRADRLGAFGYHRSLTPNIDALGNKGALFTNCYVPCARTAPSLASLLTGTWPHTHGIRDNFVTDAEAQLDVATLPQLLKPLGYRSAALSDWCGADMGKLSFGFDYTDLPDDQWNLKYLIRQGPKDLRLFISLFIHNRLGRLLLPELYYLGGVPLTSQIGKRARRLVSRLAMTPEPFFLNIFYSTTHPPFASEWPWYARFTDSAYDGESKFAMAKLTDPFEIIRRQGAPKEEFDLDQIIDLYDGCVAQFDDEVGKMLRHLEASGLAENTIVVVYSDHGMEFFEHDTWGQGNSAVGDFSSRIPLVIRDPRKPARGKIDNVVRSIDLTPTLLDLVGASSDTAMDGISLAACLAEQKDCPQLDAFNETGIWIADIPGLPEKHLRYPDLLELMEVPDRASGTLAIKTQYQDITLTAKDRMIRHGRWKLVYQPLESGYLLKLFDLETDPVCQRDVSDFEAEVKDELWNRLQAFLPLE